MELHRDWHRIVKVVFEESGIVTHTLTLVLWNLRQRHHKSKANVAIEWEEIQSQTQQSSNAYLRIRNVCTWWWRDWGRITDEPTQRLRADHRGHWGKGRNLDQIDLGCRVGRQNWSICAWTLLAVPTPLHDIAEGAGRGTLCINIFCLCLKRSWWGDTGWRSCALPSSDLSTTQIIKALSEMATETFKHKVHFIFPRSKSPLRKSVPICY